MSPTYPEKVHSFNQKQFNRDQNKQGSYDRRGREREKESKRLVEEGGRGGGDPIKIKSLI